MKTRALVMVRRHFNSPYVSEAINRANRLKWCRSVRLLGDKWKGLPMHIERQEQRG